MTTATNLDWRTLTDAEKCAAVAEADGWRFEPRLDDTKWMVWRHSSWDGAGYALECPDYLRDPRAWWSLVEEMRPVEMLRCSDDGACGMSVRVYRKDGAWVEPRESVADTPGEAVCIAFLRAKGVEVVT